MVRRYLLGNFGGIDSSIESGFGRAGGNGRLDLGVVGNSGTSEAAAPARQRQKPVTKRQV